MKGKFEHDIEKQLNDFKLEPTSQVWQQVEQSLHPERKRRIFAWWWIALIGVLISGTILWLRRDDHVSTSFATRVASEKPVTQAESVPTNTSQTKDSLSNTTINSNQEKEIDLNNIPANAGNERKPDHSKYTQESITGRLSDKAVVVAKRNNSKKEAIDEGKETSINKSSPGITVAGTPEKSIAVTEAHQEENKLNIPVTGNNTDNKDSLNIAKGIIDSSNKTSASLTSLKKVDSNTVAKNLFKKPTATGHQWLLTASGGFLNIKESFFKPINSGSLSYSSVSPGGGTGSGTNTQSFPVTDPATGFTLTLGAMYEKRLDKRWLFDAGLQYRYLQNKQTVGTDTITIVNSLQNLFYSGGNQSVVKNYAHIIELPVRIQYTLNPASANQFRLLGGLSLGVVLSEKWLITNAYQSRYYYNNSADRSVSFSGNVGLLFDHKNKWQIALLAEKTLTAIHTDASDNSAWQQYSLQFIKPISFKRK